MKIRKRDFTENSDNKKKLNISIERIFPLRRDTMQRQCKEKEFQKQKGQLKGERRKDFSNKRQHADI